MCVKQTRSVIYELKSAVIGTSGTHLLTVSAPPPYRLPAVHLSISSSLSSAMPSSMLSRVKDGSAFPAA